MTLQQRISTLSQHLLRFGRDLEFASDPRHRRSLPDGLVRVYHAHYMHHNIWSALHRADQHLARILAVQALATKPLVFSHVSSAVLLGLPLYGEIGDNVHVTTSRGGTGRASRGLERHRSDLSDSQIISSSGLIFTTANRTIADLCRRNSIEMALVCADAHLRGTFRVLRLIDEERLFEWKHEMSELLASQRGMRGSGRLRDVLALADPRTDSVLESVSHLRLKQLGFNVALQVAVAGPRGNPYYVDFEFVGLDLLGECDGKLKYVDGNLISAEESADAVYQEKRRQDWISGSEGKRMIRWGYADVDSAETFARRLRAFKVPIPSRRYR